MALKENQPRRGHLRGVSGPEGGKTGRDSFLKKNQDERGYQHDVSGPDNGKGTRPVPKETQPKRGSMAIKDGDGAGSIVKLSTEDKPDTIQRIKDVRPA